MSNALLFLAAGYATYWAFRQVKDRQRPSRTIARLTDEDEDADATAATTEVVDTSGAPLKPQHRRRAFRDLRLLPKPRIQGPIWQRPKKPKVMSFDETTRLFAGTLRTRDRKLRDLTADVEQLQRFKLPLWNSEQEVADALGISVKKLRHFSVHRPMERVRHYVQFAVPKRNGGERLILAPKRELKALQRKLKSLLVDQLPQSAYAHGFRRGRSIATYAEPHVGRRVVLRLDLKDFFPSIHVGRVRGYLISLGYSYPVAATLAVLMTESERQRVKVGDTIFHTPVGSRHTVQGAPTSPGLSNAIAQKLDHRLAGIAKKNGFAYTRYADDLAFSGDDPEQISQLIKSVSRIIHDEGFVVNTAKTRVMRASGHQSLAGVTVNHELGLSRTKRRRIRAALHQSRHNTTDKKLTARLRGMLAFVRMLNPRQSESLAKSLPWSTTS